MDLRLRKAEQAAIALRKAQVARQQAIDRLECACAEQLSRLRDRAPAPGGEVAAQDLREALLDSSYAEEVLHEMRARRTALEGTIERIGLQRKALLRRLAGFQHKARFLRDTDKIESRRKLRRQHLRDVDDSVATNL